MAAGTGRVGLLRSLVVLFGSAFVLRWIVLESLYAPEGGTLKRVLTVLAEGITLGALDYTPFSPITGYVALLALVLYMVAVALLAPPVVRTDLQLADTGLERSPGRDIVSLLLLAVLASSCGGNAEAPATVGAAKAAVDAESTEVDRARAVEIRTAALQSARVWMRPAVPVRQATLAENPPGGFLSTDEVACRFLVEKDVSGTSPKFNCQLPDGEIVKVKYGSRNAEIHAEVIATRLLHALGFGADRMYLVRKVRCAGCPAFPFQSLQCHATTGVKTACFPGGIDYDRIVDFDPAVIERRMDGSKIEALEDQGWAWFELAQIDPAKGGASRAEVDAFRLTAILLAHWDNKAANQRLVCLPGGERPDASCVKPLAMMQDVGATFGPLKLDLGNWRSLPIWKDAASCTISMQQMPWSGATFPDHRISEEGRQLLLGLLTQLTEVQVEDLFRSARVAEHDQISGEARDPRAWADAFIDKVQEIKSAGPCPPS
jgi:hypothetical protein